MNLRTFVTIIGLSAFTGFLLFGAARTFDYWQAWLYLTLSLGCYLGVVLDLARHDPALLERRKKGGAKAEVRPVQKQIIRTLVIVWLIVPALAGFDHRFGWTHVAAWLSWASAALFLAGQALMVWVLRSNTYARATVEVSEGQTLSDKGPYGWVRHPMYSAMIVSGLAVGPILGSWWVAALTALIVPLFAWRLLDGERMMLAELPGYADYKRKVRFRLAPGVW